MLSRDEREALAKKTRESHRPNDRLISIVEQIVDLLAKEGVSYSEISLILQDVDYQANERCVLTSESTSGGPS